MYFKYLWVWLELEYASVRSMCPGNRIPYLTIKDGALDYN
jgi:hypothetical protein